MTNSLQQFVELLQLAADGRVMNPHRTYWAKAPVVLRHIGSARWSFIYTCPLSVTWYFVLQQEYCSTIALIA